MRYYEVETWKWNGYAYERDCEEIETEKDAEAAYESIELNKDIPRKTLTEVDVDDAGNYMFRKIKEEDA